MYCDFEIKNVYGSLLYCGTFRSFTDALVSAVRSGISLSHVDLSGRHLFDADLTSMSAPYADFSRCKLRNTILRGANLFKSLFCNAHFSTVDVEGADLGGSTIGSAEMSNVDGLNPSLPEAVRRIFEGESPYRAYKVVSSKGEGKFVGGIHYEVGESYEVPEASTDEGTLCAAGIHLASLGWCKDQAHIPVGDRILIAEFSKDDVAVIPSKTDGKFRVKRCTIVGVETSDRAG